MAVAAGTTLSVVIAAGCSANIFSPFDKPNGDPQILEYARACLDNRDFACAYKYYGLLSTNYAETQASEIAFTILTENDATMSVFAKAVGDGGGGSSLTKVATALMVKAPGATKRAALYTAYIKVSSISSNIPLRGMVRMASGLAILGEMLAEEGLKINSSATAFVPSMMANNPTTCSTGGGAACNANCGLTGTGLLGTGAAVDYVTSPPATMTATPTWGDFHGMLSAVSHALTNELGASGSVGSGLGSVLTSMLTAGAAVVNVNTNCYRYGLLTNGVGN